VVCYNGGGAFHSYCWNAIRLVLPACVDCLEKIIETQKVKDASRGWILSSVLHQLEVVAKIIVAAYYFR
jgi:hypothetical protein